MAERGLKLINKVAIITGAGNGIGAATAKLFSKLGATVSLMDINEDSLKTVASECEKVAVGQPKPLIFVGSVGDNEFRKKYVEETVKKLAKLDILVNNAGITKLTRLLSSPLEDFDKIFDINVRSLVHMTQLASPHLIKTKGAVINLSSITSHRVYDGRLFYGMSKAAVKRFTEYAAQELGQYHVRVNSISPGVINTNIFLNYNVTKDELPKYVEQAGQKHALQRCGEPSEVADLIAFLASDESTFITGTDVLIDGGCAVMPSVSSQVEGK